MGTKAEQKERNGFGVVICVEDSIPDQCHYLPAASLPRLQ